MSRVYVASAFCNKPAVRELQARLIAAGHTLTHDWTQEDASHLPERSPEWWSFLLDCGRKDIVGITVADVVVVLAHPEMRDTRFEMGYAFGLGIQVYVLDMERAVSVFYSCVEPLASIEDLLEELAHA